jgi:hypothetical protein
MSKKECTESEHYNCVLCGCSFGNISNLNRHYKTRKHVEVEEAVFKKSIGKTYSCDDCGRQYYSRSGLWRHSKLCVNNRQLVVKDESTSELKEIITEQMKIIQNQQEMLSDVIPKIGNNNTTNNNNNTMNDNRITNNVNINLFLNSDCRDAMTIDSFVEQLKLGMSELTRTGEVGFVAGMIEIFQDSLGKMDTTERPIHCTDAKRRTMYVKNDNGWEKDVDSKETKRMVKAVKKKNCKKLDEWADNHPGARECTEPHGDDYINLMIESSGGNVVVGNETQINLDKVVNGIAKTVKLSVGKEGKLMDKN